MTKNNMFASKVYYMLITKILNLALFYSLLNMHPAYQAAENLNIWHSLNIIVMYSY